jgi:hypothetical protein
MLRSSILPLLLIAAASATSELSETDRGAAFKAGGFKLQDGQWRACEDPGTASYVPGAIETVRDLDGDGRPEAVITESSSFCYGGEGVAFSLVSKQTDGGWKLMANSPGIATFLTTKGIAGWPDLEVGGPGFCFPVMRWNGKAYVLHRHEYQGKACKP